MNNLLLVAEATANSESIKSFVDAVVGGVTSNITLADVGLVVAAIISAGIIAMFAWKFARKGFAFIKNALSGKGGKV